MATLEYASMPTNLTDLQVREVAARQREIIYSILAYFGVAIAMFGVPPGVKPFMFIPFLAVVAFAAVSFFRLAVKFYHPAMATLMLIALVIPLIGLLVLLTINGKATNLLRRNGVKVGFLGAKL